MKENKDALKGKKAVKCEPVDWNNFKLGKEEQTGKADDKKENKEEAKKSPYQYEPLTKHFVIVVFNSKKIRVEPLKVRISDFNKKEHRFKELEMKNLMLGAESMLLSLGTFNNEQEAKDYITSMFITDYIFGGMDKDQYSVLPISVGNYSVFLQEKQVEEYKSFLQENSK